jgi:hypothetical protein
MSTPIADPGAESGPRAWWRALEPRRRRFLKTVIAVGLIVVLLISVLLARFLSVENTERDNELALIQAETRGDVTGMLRLLSGCRESPSCVAAVSADASDPRVHRSGAVKILSLKSSTAYSLAGASGKTRLAWTVIGQLPLVQCVAVRRSGSFLQGITISLLSLSGPIPNEADC